MFKTIYITVILSIAILLSACSNFDLLKKDDPKVTQSENIEEVKFSIDKIALSRSFQNTTPKVEVINRNNKTSLLVTAGLIKSSGIEVKDISKDGNTINIVINNKNNSTAQLVIPQIWIDVSGIKISSLELIRFNIINDNYKPLEITYGIVDVLNKLSSDLKIASSSSPNVNLIEDGKSLIWDIVYENIFDRYSKEIPLINLNVLVDSKTGNIIRSNKSLISSLVDEGTILEFIQDEGMLYVKDIGETGYLNNLWFYSFNEKESEFLFGSNSNLVNVRLSPDKKHTAIMETKESERALYVVQNKDKKIVFINMPSSFTPRTLSWKGKDELFILSETTDNSSSLALYNIDNNNFEILTTYNTSIANFKYNKDLYLIAEVKDSSQNCSIKLSEDNIIFETIGSGYMVDFVGKDYIVFLTKSSTTDENTIGVYNIENPESSYVINRNVVDYKILDQENILIVEKNNGGSEYKASVLNLGSQEIEEIGKVNSSDVYLETRKDVLYVNLTIPFESDMSNIIYTVEKKHLSGK